MKYTPLPSLDYLNQLFYIFEDKLYWKISRRNNSVKINTPAGCLCTDGYMYSRIDNKNYRSHRIIYYMRTGIDPLENQIDHKNGIRNDNRIENFRLANHQKNQMNKVKYKTNTSGFKGVCWHKINKKWVAQIAFKQKQIYLGTYSNFIYACLVRARKEKQLFGVWSRRTLK